MTPNDGADIYLSLLPEEGHSHLSDNISAGNWKARLPTVLLCWRKLQVSIAC